MTDRRQFLSMLPAFPLLPVPLLGPAGPELSAEQKLPPDGQRIIWRYVVLDGVAGWQKIEFQDIQDGDRVLAVDWTSTAHGPLMTSLMAWQVIRGPTMAPGTDFGLLTVDWSAQMLPNVWGSRQDHEPPRPPDAG